MNAIFSPDASKVLEELEQDDKNEDLVEAIWDTVDLIMAHPTSASARRRALRTPGGHSVWLVPIPIYHEDERWVLLWQPHGTDVLIPYVGSDDFRSRRP